jgi:hypothetical protein
MQRRGVRANVVAGVGVWLAALGAAIGLAVGDPSVHLYAAEAASGLAVAGIVGPAGFLIRRGLREA